MDYGDIIVHVFYKDARKDYALEKLWSDGEAVDISTLIYILSHRIYNVALM